MRNFTLAAFNDTDPGFLRVSVDGQGRSLTLEYFVVPFAGAPSGVAADSVVVSW
jgi:hypothetical protein